MSGHHRLRNLSLIGFMVCCVLAPCGAQSTGSRHPFSLVNAVSYADWPAVSILVFIADMPTPLTATPLDRTRIEALADRYAFIFDGPDAVQLDLVPGTLEWRRFALIRGQVNEASGGGLDGVRIELLDKGDLGYTLSREGGHFDLAVNGGGTLTLRFSKAGYCPVQRRIQAEWGRIHHAPDVTLLPRDPMLHSVSLGQPQWQQIAGTLESDADGARQVRVMFPLGTTAQLVFADGHTAPLSEMNLRLTEFTVGPDGPGQMPGQLPPTSSYTYAFEAAVEEVESQGAESVQFSRSLPVYIENFLEFPVGHSVPVGFYDPRQGAWLPTESGRVIAVLDVQAGSAVLDVSGEGIPATQGELDALGIEAEELLELGGSYAIGTELWRVGLSHFSSYDCNWPSNTNPPPQTDQPQGDLDDCPCQDGSVIETLNQVIGFDIPLAGTSQQLHYRSDRSPGYNHSVQVKLSPTADQMPAPSYNLQAIHLDVTVAGRAFHYEFPPEPNQSFTFEWDGLDAYGRQTQGSEPAEMRLSYVYPQNYQTGEDLDFGSYPDQDSTVVVTGNRTTSTLNVQRVWTVMMGAWDARGAGFGGWTLSAQHFYDPYAQILYFGQGAKRSLDSRYPVVFNVAGTGEPGFSGNGEPALSAQIDFPGDVVIKPDGTIIFADVNNYRIRQIDPFGMMSQLAGSGLPGYTGDGGPAIMAKIGVASQLALDDQGNLYFSDEANFVVRRIDTDGIIDTVAGTGIPGFSGDGGPATQARMGPMGLAVGSDGALYIGDSLNARIRRVDPNGIIHTMAGTGIPGSSGDGGSALSARLSNEIRALTLDAAGNLYIVETGNQVDGIQSIRRIDPGGTITLFAGTRATGCAPESPNGPAEALDLCMPTDLVLGPNSDFYTIETGGSIIRRIGDDGFAERIAGLWQDYGYNGNGQPALNTLLDAPARGAMHPDGSLVFSDSNNHLIRKIISPFPELASPDDTLLIPDSTGTGIYQFDVGGRHLATINAFSEEDLHHFQYDDDGLLETVIMRGGEQQIQITRAHSQIDIEGPFGAVTALILNDDDQLIQVRYPDASGYDMTYDNEGFLETLTHTDGRQYDLTFEGGKLIQEKTSGGSQLDLAATETGVSLTRKVSGSQSRTAEHTLETDGSTVRTLVVENEDQQALERMDTASADAALILPDGTTVTKTFSPHPRYGMFSPLQQLNIETPAGLIFQQGLDVEETLAPVTGELQDQTLIQNTNGRTLQALFTTADRSHVITTPEGRGITTWLDAYHRPIQQHIDGAFDVAWSYDAQGRLSTLSRLWSGHVVEKRFTYDPTTGRLQRIENELDGVTDHTDFQLDAFGRPTSITLPDLQTVILGPYDAMSRPLAIVPPGRPAHTMTYSEKGHLTRYSPPSLPDTGLNDTVFTYNLAHQIQSITRATGDTISFAYEAGKKRLDTLSFDGETLDYAYDPEGRLQSISRTNTTLSWEYDGFLVTEMRWVGDIIGTVRYEYDDNFWITGIGVNLSPVVPFDHDDDGLLVQAGGLAIQRNAQNGWPQSATLGQLMTTWSYDAFGRLVEREEWMDTDLRYRETITSRDLHSRVLQKSITIDPGTGPETHTYTYTYDVNGRLKTVAVNGSPTESFGYDVAGNITDFNGSVGTYDNQDRLTAMGAVTFTHKASGERASATEAKRQLTTEYAFDTMGTLTGVTLADGTAITYLLDGQQRRIGKWVDGSLTEGYLYQNPYHIAAQLDDSGQVIARFVYGLHKHVPAYMIKNSTVYRFVVDHLGSPRLILDAQTGDVIQQLDYNAFGAITHDSNPGFQPFGFAGGLWDAHTGLYHFGRRDYDPATGRWLSKDPIGFQGGSFNLYSYCDSDPVNAVDPTGTIWHNIETFTVIGRKAVAFTDKYNLTGDPYGARDFGRHCYGSCLATLYAGGDLGGAFTNAFLANFKEAVQFTGVEHLLQQYLKDPLTLSPLAPLMGKDYWSLTETIGKESGPQSLFDIHSNNYGAVAGLMAEEECDCEEQCLQGIAMYPWL